MSTRRRILKYTPAVVMGLLVVAWVVSYFRLFGYCYEGKAYTHHVWMERGTLGSAFSRQDGREPAQFVWEKRSEPMDPKNGVLGRVWIVANLELPSWQARLPAILLLSTLLPVAIGPFISFRFSLWHYLAYTALMVVELAYYLRWQE